MSQIGTVKVSSRYQISLPSAARKQLNIQAGDQLLVDIHDQMLVLLPKPENYVARLAGLHREVWEGINTTEYLEEERGSWNP